MYPVTAWPKNMDVPLEVALNSLLEQIDRVRPGLCTLMGTYVKDGKRMYAPDNFAQKTPNEFQWASAVAYHIFGISEIQLIAYGSRCTRSYCPTKMGKRCTVVVWQITDRSKYFVSEKTCGTTLRINEFIPKDHATGSSCPKLPERYSWLILQGVRQ